MDTLFFYKQLVYKQLALSLKIAKQLWGLNHLAISNNIKLKITENRFVKDCLGIRVRKFYTKRQTDAIF